MVTRAPRTQIILLHVVLWRVMICYNERGTNVNAYVHGCYPPRVSALRQAHTIRFTPYTYEAKESLRLHVAALLMRLLSYMARRITAKHDAHDIQGESARTRGEVMMNTR